MSYDARHVANFLLDDGDENKIGISPLALQKILFFSHGWHLCLHGQPLIENEFEAWPYGPVVPIVWREFKSFRSHAITQRALFLDPFTGDRAGRIYFLPDHIQAFLSVLLRFYSQFPAEVLSDLSHNVGMPWRTVREKMRTSANLGGVIENDLILEAFHSFQKQWPMPDHATMLTALNSHLTISSAGSDSTRLAN